MKTRTALILLFLACMTALSSCPGGDKEAGPEGGVERLDEPAQWKLAREQPAIKTADAYLEYYPEGPHAGQAKAMLMQLWENEARKLTPEKMENLVAVINTNYGVIRFKFFPREAPETCRNFIRLAQSRFYDGLVFHRVLDGFLIQTGDPLGTGLGGPDYTIPAEFNDRSHAEGTVSMARGDDPDSAGSQFFICLTPQHLLDGKYTVFGQVFTGMEVVSAIGRLPTDGMDKPIRAVVDRSGSRLPIKLDDTGLPVDGPLPEGATIVEVPVMKRVYIEGL